MGEIHKPKGIEIDVAEVLERDVQDALESRDPRLHALGEQMLKCSVLLTPEPHEGTDGRQLEVRADIGPDDVPEALTELQVLAAQEINSQLIDVAPR